MSRPRKPEGTSKRSKLRRFSENPLGSYPPVFYEWIEGATKRIKPMNFLAGDKGQAINGRQRFHTFRRILSAEGHPHAQTAYSFQLSIEEREDGWWIVFKWDSLWMIKQALPQQFTPPAEVTPEKKPDSFDEALARLGYAPAPGQASGMEKIPVVQGEKGDQSACTHEWDKMEVFCLKCRIPKED